MPGLLFVVFLWTVSSIEANGYIEQPTNTPVTIGDDVVLRCTISDKVLSSRLYWQKLDEAAYKFISMDGNIDPYGIYTRDIKSRYSVIGDHEAGEYHLRIERVNVDDAGRFACVYFENGFGRYSSIANLTVMWPAPEPPNCQVTYSSSSQRVSLICLSRGGQPLASLAWRNGRTKLKGTVRTTNDVSLNIYQPGSRKFTESTFACVATTPALESPRVCRVLPVYINWRRNQLFTGDDVILTCKVFGNEIDLAISWQINDRLVLNSGKLTEFKEGKRKLIIYDVSDNELKVTCIVQNRNGLRGNASETLVIYNKESVVYQPTHMTTQTALMTTTLKKDFNEPLTTTAHIPTDNVVVNQLPDTKDVTATLRPITILQTATDRANVSAVEGTVMYDNFPGSPFEVVVDGKGSLFYKSFMAVVSVVTFLLFILVIVYGTRYHRTKTQSRREKQRQIDAKCKDSVPLAGVLHDMASESKRSDNDDSGVSFGTEIEANVDCNTIDYKDQRIIGTYPDLIISQDRKIIDEKTEEPIYMSLTNCSDEESVDESKEIKVKNNNPVYMMLDRDAERKDEVYSSVEIGKNNMSKAQNEINGTDAHKHLYAVLENDSENSVVSDLRESDFCNSGYFSGESPCEYEELPDTLPVRRKYSDRSCAYAVTDLRQVNRPLRQSLKQTLWKKLTRTNSNTMKDDKEHISRRSLPKPSRTKDVRRDNRHNALTKTNSCPLVAPTDVIEGARTPNTETLTQLRNAHFMANRPLVSRPIFGRTINTERGIVVTDDYAELEIDPSYSECQTDDTTYESLDEYTVVKKSPAKKKLTRAAPPLRLSPSFHGRELPKLKKSTSCHRCGSPNADRGFFSSSSEEEIGTIGPQTPPRILKNYKRIDQIRRDEARLKRASWPNNGMPPQRPEKRLKKSNAYSVVELD